MKEKKLDNETLPAQDKSTSRGLHQLTMKTPRELKFEDTSQLVTPIKTAAEFITEIERCYPFPWIYNISNHAGMMSMHKPEFCEVGLHTYRNGGLIEKHGYSLKGWQELLDNVKKSKLYGDGLEESEDSPVYYWPIKI